MDSVPICFQDFQANTPLNFGASPPSPWLPVFAQQSHPHHCSPSTSHCKPLRNQKTTGIHLGRRAIVESQGRHRADARLLKDARFHSTPLTRLEGILVPYHYDVAHTDEWAGKVLLSTTEWGGPCWNELSHSKINTEANRIMVERTIEALHDCDIYHGELDSEQEFRYVAINEASANHRCMRMLPLLPLDSYPSEEIVGCDELAATRALKAVDWYTEYSKLHPEVSKLAILIAQRARLYPDFPPVYPEVAVTFDRPDQNNPYAKATITRLHDAEEEAEWQETKPFQASVPAL